MGILHDDEEDLRAELAEVKEHRDRLLSVDSAWRLVAAEDKAQLAAVKASLDLALARAAAAESRDHMGLLTEQAEGFTWADLIAQQFGPDCQDGQRLFVDVVALGTTVTDLRALVRDVTAERDAATRRAEAAEAALARVKQRAISEQGPFLDRSEPPENENYNCGKWDTARAILAAIGGDHV